MTTFQICLEYFDNHTWYLDIIGCLFYVFCLFILSHAERESIGFRLPDGSMVWRESYRTMIFHDC